MKIPIKCPICKYEQQPPSREVILRQAGVYRGEDVSARGLEDMKDKLIEAAQKEFEKFKNAIVEKKDQATQKAKEQVELWREALTGYPGDWVSITCANPDPSKEEHHFLYSPSTQKVKRL